MIDISKLKKCDVLAGLYNRAMAQGLGDLHYEPEGMTPDQAQTILDGLTGGGYALRFDYLKGRVMKVDLSGDTFEERLYERDNGYGAAQSVIDKLRSKPVVNVHHTSHGIR